jgi:predicted molibdopterin-dependent oxidoreductase YjgC
VPSEKGAVNRGQACVRGRFLVREAVHHQNRIGKPLVRKHGRLEETTWDEALGTVAGKFAGYGAQDIAAMSAAQDSCEDLFVLQKFFREGLKTNNIGGAEDFSPQTHLRNFGRGQKIELPLNFKIGDIAQAKTIVLFGENLPVTQPVIGLEVYRAVRKGAKLVIIGEEEHGLNRCASAWIRIPLKQAHVMLTSISRLLLDRNNSGDAPHIDGFSEFRKSLQGGILRDVLPSLNLEEEKLLKLALLLEKRKPAAFLFGAQFSKGAPGLTNLSALWNLSLQTQGLLIPLCVENNSRGAMEIAGYFHNNEARAGRIFASINKGAYRAV